MISESYYWKRELLKMAAGLKRRLHQFRWLGGSFFRLEQTTMVGFYCIRKLVEASKVSDSIVSRKLMLTAYPTLGKRVTLINRHKLPELYDFESPHIETRPLLFVCNQIIHSYIFSPMLAADKGKGPHGVLFSSDKERHKNLFMLPLWDIICLFELIGENDPVSASMVFDPKRGDYNVTVGPQFVVQQKA